MTSSKREPVIRKRIREMMKVEDAAGQMVACAVAYDIFMGTVKAPEYAVKAAIIAILMHECCGNEHWHPLYPVIVKVLKAYPVSFFTNKPNATAILDCIRNYVVAVENTTKEHLNVSCLDA